MTKMYTWWFEELKKIFGRCDDQERSSKPSSKAAHHAIIEMNTPP